MSKLVHIQARKPPEGKMTIAEWAAWRQAEDERMAAEFSVEVQEVFAELAEGDLQALLDAAEACATER